MILREQDQLDIQEAKAVCEALGLRASVKLATRIAEEATPWASPTTNLGEFAQRLGTLMERMHDELSEVVCLRLDSGRQDYWQQPDLFGEEVTRAFPSATYDIEEAGNCYALGRNTATVFHLMRVMEVSLRALGRKVGVTGTHAGWQNVMAKTKARLELRHDDPRAFQGEERQFIADAQAQLTAVQHAWRNPTMHVERTYDDDKTEQILHAVRYFMRHLAKGLSESEEQA